MSYECWECENGEKRVSKKGNELWWCMHHDKPRFVVKRESRECVQECKEHSFVFNAYCGCFVCENCGQHSVDPQGKQLLQQCFCGWRGKNSDYKAGEPIEDDV